ncbi:MAG: recombinase family protein [Luteolibacter sp.]
MAEKTTKRCAIYTRKSSEEGLEQEYNSLDAQRDAAEAFIRSQKHEGWKALRETYDDGGISGGHMERPGLQKLIADIRAGKIDVVVVYKVDRLSRSLADFAQLMQLFEKHGVSFVSVTQQFNTSTSMGRLTLNVLLSFAQFEREVTGERIRDKIALSKQKGMWMGGIPPLGYDVVDRKLVVNPTEADTVKTCFQTYLEKSGLIETVIELNSLGLTTKPFTSRKGRVQHPKPWVAKDLHRILTNPVYRGMIRHKENEYSGEHQAVIGEDLWWEVQTKLRAHQPEAGRITGHLNEIAIAKTRLLHPLKGFVFSIDGQALTPTYTNKSEKSVDGTKVRKRYRYYVTQQAIRQGYGSSPLKTISASLLEDAVRRMLILSLPELGECVSPENLSSGEIRHRLEMHARHLARIETPGDFAGWLAGARLRIVVGAESVAIQIPIDHLPKLVECPPEESGEPVPLPVSIPTTIRHEGDRVILFAGISFKPRRGRSEIIDGQTGKEITARLTAPNPVLIQTIAQAEFWRAELHKNPSASLQEVTRKLGVEPAYVRRLINAAYLAPAIKRAVFQGTQPEHWQVQDLTAQRSADWSVQMRELGFGSLEATASR